jgi:hypothetical protein
MGFPRGESLQHRKEGLPPDSSYQHEPAPAPVTAAESQEPDRHPTGLRSSSEQCALAAPPLPRRSVWGRPPFYRRPAGGRPLTPYSDGEATATSRRTGWGPLRETKQPRPKPGLLALVIARRATAPPQNEVRRRDHRTNYRRKTYDQIEHGTPRSRERRRRRTCRSGQNTVRLQLCSRHSALGSGAGTRLWPLPLAPGHCSFRSDAPSGDEAERACPSPTPILFARATPRFFPGDRHAWSDRAAVAWQLSSRKGWKKRNGRNGHQCKNPWFPRGC